MRKIFLLLIIMLMTATAYGADQKISDLTDLGAKPAVDDEFVLHDSSTGVTKKIDYEDMSDWDNVDIYGGLTAAVAAIGSTTKTLLIDTTQTVTANLSVPTTMSLVILRSGSIYTQTGKILTLNGPILAGAYQIFFDTGTVTYNANGIYLDAWAGTEGVKIRSGGNLMYTGTSTEHTFYGRSGKDGRIVYSADNSEDNNDDIRFVFADGGELSYQTYSTGAWRTMMVIDDLQTLRYTAASGYDVLYELFANNNNTDKNKWQIKNQASTGNLFINTYASGSYSTAFKLESDRSVLMPKVLIDQATDKDMYISNAGVVGYNPSQRASKMDIETLTYEDALFVYDLIPSKFKFRKTKDKATETEYTDKEGKKRKKIKFETEYLEESQGNERYGFIADDVAGVNNQLVGYNSEGTPDYIQYNDLIAPIIAIIQKQKKLIEDLEARIEALESQ